MLITILGEPFEIKEKVTKEGKIEKMKFGKKKGERGAVSYIKEVVVEKDKVVEWNDL